MVTVGRVDFTARIDGRRTPRDAENIGRKAGSAGAEGFDETWSKGYEDSLTKAGQDALRRWRQNGNKDGTIYGQEIGRTMKKFLAEARTDVANLRLRPGFMDDFAKGFDDAGLAARDMQTKLIELNREGDINSQVFAASKRQVTEWAEEQRQAGVASNNHRDALAKLNNDLLNQKQLFDTVRSSVDRHTISLGRATEATKKQGLAWGDIPHNGRQVILITAAIAAGAESIAVLGSAAGAGIIALGGAFSQFALGGVATATVFNRLNKDLDELPESLRPVAAEFQNFQGVFGELADTIAGAAFANMGGVFSSLRESVSTLNPEFERLGGTVGTLFRDFAKSVKPGSEALEDIQELVENSADGFDQMARTAGTLGGSLVRSFNRANPLVEDLLNWIDKLVNRFDDFTRSRGFDEWMSRAQSVFGSLGPLLDAVGTSLNNLVTPASTARTIEFLDNLTAFMPDLTLLLNTIGALDVFGLASQALAEFGEALRPLAEPMREVATEIARLAGGALTGAADGFALLVSAAVPIAQILADILGAIPTEAMQGLAFAVGATASAFLLLKAAAGAGALISSLSGLSGVLTGVSGSADKATGALRTLGGKAGVIGLVAAAAAVGIPAIKELTDTLNGYDENARNAAAGTDDLGEAMRQTISGNQALIGYTDDVRVSLEQLVAVQAKGPFQRWVGDILLVDKESAVLAETLNRLDDSVSGLPIDDAIAKFSAYAQSVNASDAEVAAMLNEMPLFKAQLEAVADSSGGVATQQEVLALALGGTATGAWQAQVGMRGVKDEALLMGAQTAFTGEQIDSLAAKIRNLGSDTLSVRDAGRQYQEGLVALSDSIAANGLALDNTTAAGRANEAAVDALVLSTLDLSASTLEQTGSQEQANAVINQGREALIAQLQQFFGTKEAAAAYVDQLGLIPPSVSTQTVLTGVQNALDQIAELTRPRTVKIYGEFVGGGGTGRGLPQFASGTTVYGPTRALIGEAGPEAVVPLNRPLSMVDPSVRWLSAIAQGKQPTQAMASGGTAGTGRVVNIEAGAIVVQAAEDPRQTALEVFDALAEYVNS